MMDNKNKNKRITLGGLNQTASRVNNTYVKINELQSIFDNIRCSTGNNTITITFPDVKKGNEFILRDKSIIIDLNSYNNIITLDDGSYDKISLKPTIDSQQINTNDIYLVPVKKGETIERYVAWFYSGDWIEVNSKPISSNEIDKIIGES